MIFYKKMLLYAQILSDNEVVKETLKNEHRKIYHYHIRKTAGTSINYSFLNQGGYDNSDLLYRMLNKTKISHRIVANAKTFVSWNRFLLNKGEYFFGYSHHPMHKLDIPEKIFTITSFRDPVKRFISYYNMLKYYQKEQKDLFLLKTEGKYLGESILDLAKNTPKMHLKNQIYMFSSKFDISEASENILNKCDFIFRTETFADDMSRLSNILDLELSVPRKRIFGHKEEISKKELDLLREILDDEYKLLNIVFSEFLKKSDNQIKKIMVEKFKQ